MSFHKKVSFIKSGLRILGFGLMATEVFIAGVLIVILAEVLGIVEEVNEK